MKKVAVLTSGGDAPGMNAAIRAVVRRGIYNGLEIYGIENGYEGLIDRNFIQLDLGRVGDIIHRGGTMLRSARSETFKTNIGQEKALKSLNSACIDGLIVIGGDGSIKGASKLTKLGFPTIGIPATIDNDIAGTDYSIGFDTAVNTAMESIDKIRDTAFSHDRVCIIEVMGRGAGNIALWSGLTSGAESIIIPEVNHDIEEVVQRIQQNKSRGKMHSIIVVAEGVFKADILKHQLKQKYRIDTDVIVLGYVQRGGTPTAHDRMLSSKMGARAIDLLYKGERGIMVGWKNNMINDIPFQNILNQKKSMDISDYFLAESLSI